MSHLFLPSGSLPNTIPAPGCRQVPQSSIAGNEQPNPATIRKQQKRDTGPGPHSHRWHQEFIVVNKRHCCIIRCLCRPSNRLRTPAPVGLPERRTVVQPPILHRPRMSGPDGRLHPDRSRPSATEYLRPGRITTTPSADVPARGWPGGVQGGSRGSRGESGVGSGWVQSGSRGAQGTGWGRARVGLGRARAGQGGPGTGLVRPRPASADACIRRSIDLPVFYKDLPPTSPVRPETASPSGRSSSPRPSGSPARSPARRLPKSPDRPPH